MEIDLLYGNPTSDYNSCPVDDDRYSAYASISLQPVGAGKQLIRHAFIFLKL